MTTRRRRLEAPLLVLVGITIGALATCSRSNGPGAQLATHDAMAAPAAAHHTVLETVPDVAERAVKSVVNIATTQTVHQTGAQMPGLDDPIFRQFFGPQQRMQPRDRKMHSLGSGVIIRADGVILTNNHVVAHADTIHVTLPDGRELPAKVVGTDPKSDLAVVKLQGKVGKLQALPLGSSSSLRLGEAVLAVGDPFGVGQTVTEGIVSAKGRSHMGITDYEDFIQTDAAINPGNSGGALVNLRGQLVGINTAILSRTGGSQGIGFAIPSDMAQPIMQALLDHGEVRRGWLGVAIQDLNPDLAAGLGLDLKQGVLISDVTAKSPAARAGLRRGDVVEKLQGEPVQNTADLRNRIAAMGPDATADIVVHRDGHEVSVKVKLGKLSSAVAQNGAPATTDKGLLGGVTVAPLDDQVRQKLGLADNVDHGVVVTEVQPGSAAGSLGLQKGDVVLELNKQPIKTVGDFEKAAGRAGHSALLLVYRHGTTLYLAMRR